MKLRDYQQAAVDSVFAYWDRDKLPPLASPCVEVPTGGGKSAILGELTRKLVQDFGCRVVLATHRSELIEQDAGDMREIWPGAPIGIYSASLNSRNGTTAVCLAGVQTVANKAKDLGHRDVLLIDEAHLVNPEDGTQYRQLIDGLRDINPDMRLVGLTATPYRLGQGFLTSGDNALFDSICYRISVTDLINQGFLSPLVSGFVSAQINADDIAVRAGEFVAKDLELACNVDEITEHVAADLATAFERGCKKALVYGCSIAHASFLRNAIRMRGISCELIDGTMDKFQRKQIIKQFKKGEIQCISSCDVLTTGFNVPDVDVLSLVRPTMSTALYVQIMGRGMRISPEKTKCTVLDYGGNVARHGPIDNLKIKEKPKGKSDKKASTKECPVCFAECPPAGRECPHCGHQFPPPERKANQHASNLPVLSGAKQKPKTTTYSITDTIARKHYKGRDTSNTPTCAVEYFAGTSGRPCATDWLCFEHESGGFAWKKACQWWSDNVGTVPIPETIDEAVKRINSREFPTVIEVIVDESSDFPRVMQVIQDENSLRQPGEDKEENDPEKDEWLDDDLPF